jgi:preprotein translocase subunit SecG
MTPTRPNKEEILIKTTFWKKTCFFIFCIFWLKIYLKSLKKTDWTLSWLSKANHDPY